MSDYNNIKLIDGQLSKLDLNSLTIWLNEYCSIKNMNKLTNLEAIYAIWDALNPEDEN